MGRHSKRFMQPIQWMIYLIAGCRNDLQPRKVVVQLVAGSLISSAAENYWLA